MRLLAALTALLFASAAHAASAPDSLVVTGPVMQQIPIGKLLITPTGGTQTTLAYALASAGGGVAYTQQINQPVTATAYGNGQAVGGLMTFSASAHFPVYAGNISGMAFTLPDTQTPTLDVLVFNANPTTSTITNGQQVVISAADQAKQIGVLHISDCTGTQTFCQSQQSPIGYNLLAATSSTLYAVIIARNSFTPSNLPVGAPAWLATLVTQQN